MEQGGASRYWCHVCSQTVSPIMGIEEAAIKCPICEGGFLEETASAPAPEPAPLDLTGSGSGAGSEPDRALSLWAPILLGMMANPIRHPPVRRLEGEGEDHNDPNPNPNGSTDQEQLDSLMRMRRRRNSAAILQLLHGIRAGLMLESANQDSTDGDENRERVILINPFNQTIIVQSSSPNSSPSPGLTSTDPNTRGPIGTLGDYFLGPGLDLLIQHLTENDPDRQGIPPAKKEAVEALNTVRVDESMQLQCCICLDDCNVGDEVKEMPCKHRFHTACIVSWLELHGSCPVCRYQLPGEESGNPTGQGAGSGRRSSLPLFWPFNSLFASPTSQASLALPSGSFTDAPSATSRADEN